MPRPKKEKPNRSDGLYEIKITIGKDINGKLKRKSFYSSISKDDARRQADKWKVEREVANRTGIGAPNKTKNFCEWATAWLETKKGTVKPYTYQNTYKVKLDKYILPYFGQADISITAKIYVHNDISVLRKDMGF